jgi:predicted RNA-binding protein with PUA domain
MMVFFLQELNNIINNNKAVEVILWGFIFVVFFNFNKEEGVNKKI